MFAQPWAWLGLVGLAVPIAIHMLARHQAVRTLFPSLRFIDATDVTFIKRQRLTDIPLLIVRLAIVAVAVAAIAGPRWAARGTGGRASAVAVVVDASAGVIGGEAATVAKTEAATSETSAIVDAVSLPAGINSAAAWLATQSGPRTIVVVSDFQRGSLDGDAIAKVPAGVGLRFHALPIVPSKLPPGFELRGDRSRMAWPVASPGGVLPLAVKAGPDQDRAAAMLSAVSSLVVTAPVDASARHATLVFPSAPERKDVVASGSAINQPWMFAVVEPLLSDSVMRAKLSTYSAGGDLLIVVDDDPASALSATVASTVLASLVQPLAWSELEPSTIAADQLRAWERAPSDAPSVNSGEPQGRWLWIVALALLALETWMRRRRAVVVAEEAHARVA